MLHPQTIAAAVLAIVAALNGSDALDAQPARRVRPPRGQQYDFWFGTSKLTELKFQKKFRLSRDAFVDLTESIRGDLGKNAAACALSPESKLAVALRWLGGASAWELTQIYWPSARGAGAPAWPPGWSGPVGPACAPRCRLSSYTRPMGGRAL